MLQKRHEKIIYENDRGERIEIGYSFPFLLQQFIGADGANIDMSTSKGVGQDGTTIRNVSMTERPLQILGKIKGQDKEELAKYRAKLNSVFNPKIKGWLQYEYGNVVRKIRVQPDGAPYFSKPFATFEILDFMVDLVAPNPYWLSDVENSIEISNWIGGMSFPLMLPTSFALKGENIKLIVNEGDVETPVKIEILGPATNPKIKNTLTGEYVRINRTVLADKSLIVTTGYGDKRVELDGESVFNYIDLESTFFQLCAGDNVIEVTTEDVNDSAKVKITYSNMYIGV